MISKKNENPFSAVLYLAFNAYHFFSSSHASALTHLKVCNHPTREGEGGRGKGISLGEGEGDKSWGGGRGKGERIKDREGGKGINLGRGKGTKIGERGRRISLGEGGKG